jgi:hypothetical protein
VGALHRPVRAPYFLIIGMKASQRGQVALLDRAE